MDPHINTKEKTKNQKPQCCTSVQLLFEHKYYPSFEVVICTCVKYLDKQVSLLPVHYGENALLQQHLLQTLLGGAWFHHNHLIMHQFLESLHLGMKDSFLVKSHAEYHDQCILCKHSMALQRSVNMANMKKTAYPSFSIKYIVA